MNCRKNTRLKKLSQSILLSIVLAYWPSFNSLAVSASISNGTNCGKVNSVTKVKGKTYRCSYNPFLKPSRLTWTRIECIQANRLLKSSRAQYEDWKELAKLAGPEGEKTLLDLQSSILELENTMKMDICKRRA